MFDGDLLLRQLSSLGRDLDDEVQKLGELDMFATEREGEYRFAQEEHEDRLAEAFQASQGGVETRKAEARIKCTPSRLGAGEALLEWRRAQSRLRTQQAQLQAIHRRIEIGRSMLSREKALLELDRLPEPR